MAELIRLENANKIYNLSNSEVRAMDNMSLKIDEGEFVAIVGKSGSGKSTLMNIIGCLDIQTSGKYYLEGTDVSKLSDNELSKIRNFKIGFIFQGFNLISTLDAYENVELPLVYRGIDKYTRRNLIINALGKVGLLERMHHRPSQMSGGQQQRVSIARAIASSPSIILADEPTGNLDSKSGNEIMDILTQLNQEGKTVILITHDDNIAKQAKRVIKIQDGTIISDTREELLNNKLKAQVIECL